MTYVFPDGFVWGAATSAYQIEGAASEDGRADANWDAFCRIPGAIQDGTTGAVACDHYHRVEEDVALMAALGLPAYRFSVAWPRIQPDGRGAVNQAGLDFYRRLVDLLLEHGIEPYPTLFHWDLPQALEEGGGWADRTTAELFASYAEVVCDALGDRVQNWTTLNEPWCSAMLGYAAGVKAPGIQDPQQAFTAAHHLLLGHGLAAQVLAGDGKTTALTLNLTPYTPASSREEDVSAARNLDGLMNRLFLDPVLRGTYPDDVLAIWERVAGLGALQPGDEDVIGAPLDALGVNYYASGVVASRPGATAGPSPWPGVTDAHVLPPEGVTTAMGWGIDSRGLIDVLLRVQQEYPPVALYITENGAAFEDQPGADGSVDDPDRISYLDLHLRAAHDAIAKGVDLRGYFVWSLLDNFEWEFGYTKRFGIVHVDYATQRRTLKNSALWYRDVIARNGLGSS